MARLTWGDPETRRFEDGISRAVLYVDGGYGVPWNGVVSIEEAPEGGEPHSFFYDGEKYKQTFTSEVFEGKIEAYTYPDEFAVCMGLRSIRPGFGIGYQNKKPFNLCYRTEIGDGITQDKGYKLHLVYNVWAGATELTRQTRGSDSEPALFSWDLTTVPIKVPGYRSSSYFVLDSSAIEQETMAAIEDLLYGTDETLATFPTTDEILSILGIPEDPITLTVFGDTFEVSGTRRQVSLLTGGRFSVDSDFVTVTDDKYTISTD